MLGCLGCCGGLPTLAFSNFQIPDETDQAEVGVEQIQQWIGQLGASDLAVRRNATRAIWRHGRDHLDILKQHVDSEDREKRARISSLIRFLEAGVSPDMPSTLARSIAIFRSADADVRKSIIDLLTTESRYDTIWELLQTLEESDRAALIYRTRWLSQLISDRVDEKDWAGIETLFSDPVVFSVAQSRAMFFFIRQGELERHIRRIRASLKGVENPNRLALNQLVQLQFASDQYMEIDPLYHNDAAARKGQLSVEASWYIEKAQWTTLSNRLAEKNDKDKDRWQVEFGLPMLMALHRFAEREDRHRKCLDEFLKDAEPGSYTATVLFLNFEFDKAIEMLGDASKDVAFDVLCQAQQYDRAFELIGMPDPLESRFDWFAKKTRTYRSLNKKLSRGVDRQETSRRATSLFVQLSMGAYYLGNLGHDEEAIYYLQQLSQASTGNSYQTKRRNFIILRYLLRMERFDAAIEFATTAIGKNELTDPYLFPENAPTASFWFQKLEERIPETRERLEYVGSMLKTVWADPRQTFDIDAFLPIAYEASEKDSYRQMFHAGVVAERQGRDELAISFYTESANGNQLNAMMALGKLYWKQEKWAEAALWFRRASQFSQEMVYRLMEALCYRKLGDQETANEKLSQALLQSQNDYDFYRVQSSLRQVGTVDEIKWFLEQLILTRTPGDYYQKYYHHQLAFLLAEDRPQEAMSHLRIHLLNSVKDAAQIERDVPTLVASFRLDAGFQAKSLLDKGKTEKAIQLLELIQRTFPGDAGLAEDFVPRLEALGEKEAADRLFDQVADHYLSLLDRFPDSATYLNNYAWICATCNRKVSSVLPYSLRAVELKPRNPSYHDTLAEVYFRTGNREKAIAHSQKCVELNPTRKHYREQLERFRSEPLNSR